MGQLILWTYFLLIALIAAPVQRVMGCSCLMSHPQTIFCQSDYVAVVRVKRMDYVTPSRHEIAYSVKVNKVFKQWTTVNPEEFSKQNTLFTPSMEGLCGVHLKIGETYVIAGKIMDGKIRLSICGLAKPWSEVPNRQRKGFRGLYHRGCACEIHFTPWWRKGAVLDSVGRKQCLWESTPGPQHCQEQYGMCMAGPGGCSWIPSVPYKNCIKEHQRKREQQRLREP
ncbi:tissue inhibitor of metalloproteases [Calliopsis andreniformis]|uniref:tissue inhibitor of metalloproteases n=1 Tax=Calliopsis andreniformis TaxID=337506 RepID=UPI003FCC737A